MPKKTGWRNPAIKWVMKQRNSCEGSTTTCGLFSIQTRLEKRRTSFHELFCDSNRTLKKRLKVSSLVPSKRPLQTAKTAGLHSSVPRSLAQRSSRARTHRRQAQPGRLYRSLQNITLSNAVVSLSSYFGKWILVCNFSIITFGFQIIESHTDIHLPFIRCEKMKDACFNILDFPRIGMEELTCSSWNHYSILQSCQSANRCLNIADFAWSKFKLTSDWKPHKTHAPILFPETQSEAVRSGRLQLIRYDATALPLSPIAYPFIDPRLEYRSARSSIVQTTFFVENKPMRKLTENE